MDLVRYVLAIAVVIAHLNELAGLHLPFPISSFEAVGGFFAISGFLMYPNYTKHDSLLKYTRQRARRIIPPYVFTVVIAAICLASISTLSPKEYYLSGDFFAYLGANLTFLNWLHPELPGVFQSEEFTTPAVNGSLWTMKVEWCLYFSVPCFLLIERRIKGIKRHWLALSIAVFAIAYRLVFTSLYHSTGKEIYNILSRQIFGQLSYFYVGILIYFFRDFFCRNLTVMFCAGLALRMLMPVSHTCNIILSPFAITLIIMAISLTPYDLKMLRHRNNVSYEIYLFHYPVIQLCVFFGLTHGNELISLTYVLVSTAALSLAAHSGINRLLFRRPRLSS